MQLYNKYTSGDKNIYLINIYDKINIYHVIKIFISNKYIKYVVPPSNIKVNHILLPKYYMSSVYEMIHHLLGLLPIPIPNHKSIAIPNTYTELKMYSRKFQ